jgi:hypothetical protein
MHVQVHSPRTRRHAGSATRAEHERWLSGGIHAGSRIVTRSEGSRVSGCPPMSSRWICTNSAATQQPGTRGPGSGKKCHGWFRRWRRPSRASVALWGLLPRAAPRPGRAVRPPGGGHKADSSRPTAATTGKTVDERAAVPPSGQRGAVLKTGRNTNGMVRAVIRQ